MRYLLVILIVLLPGCQADAKPHKHQPPPMPPLVHYVWVVECTADAGAVFPVSLTFTSLAVQRPGWLYRHSDSDGTGLVTISLVELFVPVGSEWSASVTFAAPGIQIVEWNP